MGNGDGIGAGVFKAANRADEGNENDDDDRVAATAMVPPSVPPNVAARWAALVTKIETSPSVTMHLEVITAATSITPATLPANTAGAGAGVASVPSSTHGAVAVAVAVAAAVGGSDDAGGVVTQTPPGTETACENAVQPRNYSPTGALYAPTVLACAASPAAAAVAVAVNRLTDEAGPVEIPLSNR